MRWVPMNQAASSHQASQLAPDFLCQFVITRGSDAIRERPKVLYCTPTLYNPTTATMSGVWSRRHGVPVL